MATIKATQDNVQPFEGTLPFIDLQSQYALIQHQIEHRMKEVLKHGHYIMGPEVYELEAKLADYTGAKHVISCSNGTDALWLSLLALDIGVNDAVFVPSFTFTATAEAVVLCGASPVFVDVLTDSFNLSPDSLERAIVHVQQHTSLRPRAIIAVDLFGLPADYQKIGVIAARYGLRIIADAAQSFGGSYGTSKVGILADITTTSFFPAKPLGCYGDGGAIFVEDAEIAETLRSLRIHGRGAGGKYDNVRIGTNARLDTLQAAIASFYNAQLANVVDVPLVQQGYISAWAQYTLRSKKRNMINALLKERGIPTHVYYPKPLHMQALYANYPSDPAGLSITEKLADEVLSLPMHPYLRADIQQYIVNSIRGVFHE